jgi:hypothetical protein
MPTDSKTKFSLLRVVWTSSGRASRETIIAGCKGGAVTQGATGLPLSSPREADLKNQTNPVVKPSARERRPAAAGGAAGLGQVMTASGHPRLLFIVLHRKGTSDNRDCCGARRRLDLLRRVIAVEHGQLDVHRHAIGAFGSRLGDALGALNGRNHGIPRGGRAIAPDGAQVLLVLDNQNAKFFCLTPVQPSSFRDQLPALYSAKRRRSNEY